MKTTRFWIILFTGLIIAAAIISLLILPDHTNGAVAAIYQNGELIYRIDLSKVQESRTLQIDDAVENTVTVEHGRICISEATCPDQVCVNQGWISDDILPIVCLPNALVIQIENAPDLETDAVVK